MSFATLQDAWGVANFAAPTPPPLKPMTAAFDPSVKNYSLKPELDSQARLQEFVRGVYRTKGIKGVKQVLGPSLVQELCRNQCRAWKREQQTQQQEQEQQQSMPPWLDPESIILFALAAFSLLVIMDSME